ncbi:hypothetical protein [Bradyrhizobium sp.]|uniref:hypothetical protein n=1 Tax=Bradyrhizobium sp. TaxID=376 RepID=UPI0039E5A34C
MDADDLEELDELLDALLNAHFDLELLDRGGQRDPRLRPRFQEEFDDARKELIAFIQRTRSS